MFCAFEEAPENSYMERHLLMHAAVFKLSLYLPYLKRDVTLSSCSSAFDCRAVKTASGMS